MVGSFAFLLEVCVGVCGGHVLTVLEEVREEKKMCCDRSQLLWSRFESSQAEDTI